MLIFAIICSIIILKLHKEGFQMRVLNTNIYPSKKFKRFTWPGFRSGSTFKRIVAMFYYFFVFIFMCSVTVNYAGGKFSGTSDILVLIGVELSLLLMFLSPVIALGYSEHFNWHGIKLFLIIMVAFCFFSTLGNWLSTLFSIEYTESVNPSEKQIEEVSDALSDSASSEALSDIGVTSDSQN